jgi:hypothetical protein
MGMMALLAACAPRTTPTPIYLPFETAAPAATPALEAIPIVMPTPDPLMRSHDANAVYVEIAPRNLYETAAETLEFDVAFTTHSVDLDYDFAAQATLRSAADEEVTALKWDGPRGGHHVFGVLSFPALNTRGQTITLVLRDIAGVSERTFVWPATP